MLYLIGGAVLIYCLNAGMGVLALKKLETKAGARISGVFLPHAFQPSFTLKDPQLKWQDRFQVTSGTVKVQYDPLFLLPGHVFRVRIWGRELGVKLFGELIESQGLSEMVVTRVDADLAFARGKNPEIFLLDIRSPELQFLLAKE